MASRQILKIMCHNMLALERRRASVLLNQLYLNHCWDNFRSGFIPAVLFCKDFLLNITRGNWKTITQEFCAVTTKLNNAVTVSTKPLKVKCCCKLDPAALALPVVWPESHCRLSEKRWGSQTPRRTNHFREGSTLSHYSEPRLDHSSLSTRLRKPNRGTQCMSPMKNCINYSHDWYACKEPL